MSISIEQSDTERRQANAAASGIPDAAATRARAQDGVRERIAVDPATVLQLQALVHDQDGFAPAAQSLIGELARQTGALRVHLGMLDGAFVRLVARSGAAEQLPRNAASRAVEAALDEAIEQGAVVRHPDVPGARPRVDIAHAEWARSASAAVLGVPLVASGRAIGALGFEFAAGAPIPAAACEVLAGALAPTLDLKRDATMPWHGRALRAWRRGATDGAGWRRGALVVVAALAVIGVGLLPVKYRVGAPARLEGAIQRVLVAPADGFLQHVKVKPGDAVTSGQVLAELADQDLAIEARKWGSELAQHENSARAALARGDRTQYVIYLGRAAEARAQLDLVEQQLARGRIRAPFDGILIKGDLTQMLGAPVQRGDTLLTVAPSREYRVIVEIDERDIGAVRMGAPGELALAALPAETVRFAIVRVTPVATTREGRNFYEVEGRLESSPAGLRPGLQGVGKVDAGRRSLAWIWGHRVVDWALLAIWSLGL